MGASVSSCCLLHLFLSQGESRDQTFPHPLDQNRACRDFFVPPTYPSHHNRTIPCICFVLLNICTRWTIIATVGPRPRYPLQGAGDQGGRTSTGSRWEMACLQAGGGPQPVTPVLDKHRVPRVAGCLAGATPSSLSWALDMLRGKGLQGRKEHISFCPLPCHFWRAEATHMCFTLPTSNDCS